MTTSLAQQVRINRERQLHQEKLRLIARKVKNLADEAFDLREEAIGKRLLDDAGFIQAIVKVREG